MDKKSPATQSQQDTSKPRKQVNDTCLSELLTQLSNELTTLNEFVKQRALDASKDDLEPEYLRMVTPHYERELIAVTRIQELIQHIYFNEAP